MSKPLQVHARECPVVCVRQGGADYADLFGSEVPPRCIILKDTQGLFEGVVLQDAPQIVQTDVLVLDADQSSLVHLDCLVESDLDSVRYGVVLTDEGAFFGWVPPEDVSRWLASTARESMREVKSAQDRMQAKDRQSVMFLANMSHELRTPLNAIIGYADLIRSKTFGPIVPTQYGSYVESIHRSGQHLLSSITALLNLAKIDAGALRLNEEEVSVEHLIHQTLDMISTEANALRVDVVAKVPEGFPKLYADVQLVRQSLLNLVSNAVKFSPSGGTVRVTATRTERGGIRITVVDRGPGIPEDELHQLIRPFKQASHGPGRTGIGTGLGLSLAKAFIEMHEGRLRLFSEEGKGTRAMLTLPSGRARDTSPGFQEGFAFVRDEAIA